MTAPQLTFALATVLFSLILTAVFYRGVLRYASSKRDSFLAASMAGLICAAPLAWALAAIVNAIGSV